MIFGKGLHKGLYGRLTARGMPPVVAIEIASANYPSRTRNPIRPPIVTTRTVNRLTEQCVDYGTMTLDDLFQNVWGLRATAYFDFSVDEGRHKPGGLSQPVIGAIHDLAADITRDVNANVEWAYKQADRRGIARHLALTILKEVGTSYVRLTADDISAYYSVTWPDRMNQLRSEGVTEADASRFWGRPEYIRVYLARLNQLEHQLFAERISRGGLDADEVARHVRQNLPRFDWRPSTGSDAPLPWELYDRVMDYLDLHGTVDDQAFQSRHRGSSSLNATLRRCIAEGLL